MAQAATSASALESPEKALVQVVDDDPDLVAVIAQALLDRGYRVVTAHNGAEALTQLDNEAPRLILLDMWMPVMDGWAFARVLHERYGRGIPVVVMTAARDARLRANEIGADADLGKPFALAQLYAVVEDTLGSDGV
jgi:CheY-like chemotaxis protein